MSSVRSLLVNLPKTIFICITINLNIGKGHLSIPYCKIIWLIHLLIYYIKPSCFRLYTSFLQYRCMQNHGRQFALYVLSLFFHLLADCCFEFFPMFAYRSRKYESNSESLFYFKPYSFSFCFDNFWEKGNDFFIFIFCDKA